MRKVHQYLLWHGDRVRGRWIPMVSYTAEIELRPVVDGEIKRKYDSETGTGFWSFT